MKKRFAKTAALLLAAIMLLCCHSALAEGIEDWAAEEPRITLWDEGELVARLQYELAACGYYHGEESGVFDSATFRAVKALQADLGVTVDGVYGQDTHRAYVEAVRSGEIVPDYPYYHLLEGCVIGIDPGHQSQADMGLEAVSPMNPQLLKYRMTAGCAGVRTGVNEQSINLEVALYLKELLEKHGAAVVLTRSSGDAMLSNMERAELMNGAQVDLWVRIHCNYSADPNLNGARILLPGGISNFSISAESRRLGWCVIDSFCGVTGAERLAPHRLTDQTGFNWSDSPVVALELGYLSNSISDLRLCRASYQSKCAQGIYLGILDYVNGRDPFVDTYDGGTD